VYLPFQQEDDENKHQRVCCIGPCAVEATGSGQHAHESGFMVCKPDFKFRMNILVVSYLLLRLTCVHSFSFPADLLVVRETSSVMLPFVSFCTYVFLARSTCCYYLVFIGCIVGGRNRGAVNGSRKEREGEGKERRK
jgi:hypothetical protein